MTTRDLKSNSDVTASLAPAARTATASGTGVDLRGYEGVWMAWRAGSVLLVALGLVAARALSGRLGFTHAIILAPAVLTVSLDVYNAADVSNRSASLAEIRPLSSASQTHRSQVATPTTVRSVIRASIPVVSPESFGSPQAS